MNVLRFDYNLQNGFAWIMVGGKNPDDEMIVQCCLDQDEDDNYIKEIIIAHCGHNWGLCADANEEAFKHWGENSCMAALFYYAQENDFNLV